jgi:tetratricopeptide (TPR) repeat protein
MKRWSSFALAGALALAGCGDSSNQAADNTQATPAATVAKNAATQGAATQGAVAESRGQQLLREAERAANVGRDLEARETYERALAAFRGAGDRIGEARTLLALGSLDRAMGQGERGRQVLTQAVAAFAAAGDERGRADATFAMGELERAQFNNERARAIFDTAADMYRALDDWSGEARALLGRADSERRLGLILDARRAAARAVAIYTVLEDSAGLVLARRTLNEVVGNYPDDYEAKRGEIRDAILAQQQAGEPLAEAQHQLELATLERHTGRPAKARERYNKAIALYREGRDILGTIYAVLGLADMERGLERFEAARDAYTDAQALIREIGDEEAEAHLLVSLAEMDATMGDPRALLEESQEINRRTRNRIGEAMGLIALGRIEQRAGNILVAARNFNAAYQMLQQSDDEVGAATALLATGALHRQLGEVEPSIDALIRARVIFERTGYRLGEAWALLSLGQSLAGARATDARVSLLGAAYVFDTLGMERRRDEAVAAAAIPR